ncbi:endonuclease, partial [Klebsiella pneumoniae]
KYPNVRCRAISAQFVSSDLIALFELKIDEGQVKLIEERHYKLVPVKELDSSDISNYRMSV